MLFTLIASGRQSKAGVELMLEWIVKAWDAIPVEIITKSFLKTSISNTLDGSQNAFLCEDLVRKPESDDLDDNSYLVIQKVTLNQRMTRPWHV